MRPIFLSFLAILPACGSLGLRGAQPAAPSGVTFVQARRDWSSAARARPDSGAQRAAALEAYRAEHGVPLSFWPSDSLGALPPRGRAKLVIDDHPCGRSLTAFVKRIPLQDPVLVAEFAVELDSAGRATTTWQIPIDVLVRGVRGSELLIAAPMPGLTLAIRPNGEFHVVALDSLPRSEKVECPRLAIFGRSDYLICRDFVDGAHTRRIAYQGLCT